jgi:hypothetical protein
MAAVVRAGTLSPLLAPRVRDPLCIVLVSAICAAAYVTGLRYYSDDYLFLVPLARSADQSWSGLYHALAEIPFAAVRPGQILWYVAFYKLAPGQVTLVHLANHAVFIAASLVMYAALRAVPATRRAAYHVTLLYVCLPTFSVAKMWYSNHQAALSLLMFTLSWWLLARMAQGTGRRRWLLPLPIALAAGIGNLCYELFWVAGLLLPAFVWLGCGARLRDLPRNRAFVTASAAIALAFAATTLFKLTYHYGFALPATGHQAAQFVRRAAGLYLGAARNTFWTLGAWSPRAAWGMLRSPYLQPGSLLAPLLVLVVIGAREWCAQASAHGDGRTRERLGFLAVAGIVAFPLGYAPYLTNFLYSPKPWGEGNRGNVASALGAALLIYALFRWASTRWPLPARAALVLYCTIGAFLQVAIGQTWVRAAREQDRVASEFVRIARDRVGAGDTVLLYGSCPYYGAGPVFPYGWDLAGHLAAIPRYRDVKIGVLFPDMHAGSEGVASPPGRWSTFFPYRSLYVVDLAGGTIEPLAGPAEAQRYFSAHPFARAITCRFDFGVGNPLY